MIVNDSNLAWYNAIMGQKQEGPLYKMKPQACLGDALSGFFHIQEMKFVGCRFITDAPAAGRGFRQGKLAAGANGFTPPNRMTSTPAFTSPATGIRPAHFA